MPLSAEDRLDLMELMARYANAVDIGGREEDLFSIFTEDATLDSPIAGKFAGMEGLKQFGAALNAARKLMIGRHHISNLRIQGDGSTATLQAYFIHSFTPHHPVPPRTHRTTEVLNSGSYDCTAKKIDGRWRLSRRNVSVDDRQ